VGLRQAPWAVCAWLRQTQRGGPLNRIVRRQSSSAHAQSPPQMRIVNILFRLVGLWFVAGGSLAIVATVLDALLRGPPRTAEGPVFYIASTVVAFGCAIALGIVLLKVRSFRGDLPPPRDGQRTKWWTGDIEERSNGIAV
jgi:hypothetical protein